MNIDYAMARPKRLGLHDKSRELAAMKDCREAMTRILAAYKIGSPEYVAAGEVLEKLDNLAELLSGDRNPLWPKGHGTP
jgi:hypothetical protein